MDLKLSVAGISAEVLALTCKGHLPTVPFFTLEQRPKGSKLLQPGELPELRSLAVTFHQKPGSTLKPSHLAPFLLAWYTPELKTASFSTFPATSAAFSLPGEWYLPLRCAPRWALHACMHATPACIRTS